MPKKNRSVIVLSSMHHYARIPDEANIQHKPDILLYYNETKSGVDNLDHLLRLYSCKRKVNRWPVCLFFNMLNCAAFAAYFVWMKKYPEWNQGQLYKSCLFLRELDRPMLEEYMYRRLENPQYFTPDMKLSFNALGIDIPHVAAAIPAEVHFLCSRSRSENSSSVQQLSHELLQ